MLGHGYQPDTPQGRWLLAHELAHVIQQSDGRGTPAHVDAATLEQIANAAADIVASGGSLPVCFDFGSAPYGMIQRHADDPCTGTRYNASQREIWMAANNAIEQAYRDAHPNNSVFFGSDFEDSLLKIGPEGCAGTEDKTGRHALPKRRCRRVWGKGTSATFFCAICAGWRGSADPTSSISPTALFTRSKYTGYEDRGRMQLESYYKITEAILTKHGENEPGWHPESTPDRYPRHVLPMLDTRSQDGTRRLHRSDRLHTLSRHDHLRGASVAEAPPPQAHSRDPECTTPELEHHKLAGG